MISVVIPAFNEEDAISSVVKGVREALTGADIDDYEIIVVDDGSGDRTAELAENAGARLIRNLHNIGYGFSLKRGIRAAKHDTIAIADGDGSYPVEMIPTLVDRYQEGFNLVVGARKGPHYRESFIKYPLRKIFKWLVEFTVGRCVQDVNSGLRVFSRKEIMPYFPRLSNRFSFTTSQTMVYMLKMKFVVYVPIDYRKRIGKTKVRLFRDSLRALQMIVSAILYFNPLKLFIVLCGITGLFAAGAIFAWLVWQVEGALWIGSIAVLIALVIFALGLLADLLRQTVSDTHDS